MNRHEIVLIPVEAISDNPLEEKGEKPTEPKDKEKSKPKGQDVLIGALMYDVAKKIGINAISRIGSVTGDYIMQDQVKNIMNASTYALAIAKGGVIGAVYVGLDVGMKVFDYTLSRDKGWRETQAYRESVGISTAKHSRLGGMRL